jgi:hypothetical protein
LSLVHPFSNIAYRDYYPTSQASRT